MAKSLQQSKNIKFFLSGPAVDVFSAMDIFHSELDIETVVDSCDAIITGTGWQSDLEQETLRIATSSGKPCFVLLDHWQEFRARFHEESIQEFPPTCLLVTNIYAQYLASLELPEIPCLRIEDLYINSILQEYNLVVSKNSTLQNDSILYLSNGQPYDFELPFGQLIQLLKVLDLTSVAQNLGRRFNRRIRLRPHPADQDVPFNILENFSVFLDKESGSLLKQLHQAGLVVGADTYALYVAMKIGKPVVTVLSESEKPTWLGFAPSIDELQSSHFMRLIFFSLFNRFINGFYFRLFSVTDIDDCHLATLNDSEYMQFSSNSSGRISFSEACDYTKNLRLTGGYHLAIINSWHEQIGTCTLRVNENSKRVEIGILIYRKFSGRGEGLRVWKILTTELSIILPEYTFWAGTMQRNTAMVRILQQSGYLEIESKWEDYLSSNKLEKILIYEYPNENATF